MKKLLFILNLTLSITLLSQEIELYGGPHGNSSYRLRDKDQFSNNLTPLIGYRIGFNLHPNSKNWKLGISHIDYSGSFISGYFNVAGGQTTSGNYWNQAVSIDFYPSIIKLKKNLEIAFGLNLSYRYNSEIEGTYTYWMATAPYSSQATYLNSDYGRKIGGGLLLNLNYKINLNQYWTLTPQFLSNLFITSEYDNFSKWMNLLGFGLRYTFQP